MLLSSWSLRITHIMGCLRDDKILRLHVVNWFVDPD